VCLFDIHACGLKSCPFYGRSTDRSNVSVHCKPIYACRHAPVNKSGTGTRRLFPRSIINLFIPAIVKACVTGFDGHFTIDWLRAGVSRCKTVCRARPPTRVVIDETPGRPMGAQKGAES